MSVFGGGLLDMVKARMAWASQRQTLIARNIANANTPGFTPVDLDERKFARFMARAAEAAPGPSGLRGTISPGGRMFATVSDGETTPNGEGVNLERQMMKAAENSLDYQQAAGLYRKAMGMWRTALGRSGG